MTVDTSFLILPCHSTPPFSNSHTHPLAVTGIFVREHFHCAPSIPHYANNKAVGVMKPGMIFTIEPMINAGTWRDTTWPDGGPPAWLSQCTASAVQSVYGSEA